MVSNNSVLCVYFLYTKNKFCERPIGLRPKVKFCVKFYVQKVTFSNNLT